MNEEDHTHTKRELLEIVITLAADMVSQAHARWVPSKQHDWPLSQLCLPLIVRELPISLPRALRPI